MTESDIGVVIIGRNEGERLRVCLQSARHLEARVYVDSGSTDGSCDLARSLGFEVVELPIPPGFTAARARNAGVDRLVSRTPGLRFVQTIDGDCELAEGWLAVARADMETDERRAVVFGRRRERFPDANAYHLVCDDEWNVPLGEVSSCGGDALFRLSAFHEVQGFNPRLIAGEEPDLCLRLRQRGWTIWSNGRPMTAHDVAISTVSQWWQRARRAGYAFSALDDLHGKAADPAWSRLVRGALVWTTVVAAALLFAVAAILSRHAVPTLLAAVLALLIALQLVRLALKQKPRLGSFRAGLQWSRLIMIAKLAQAFGWLEYRRKRASGASATLIEYKH